MLSYLKILFIFNSILSTPLCIGSRFRVVLKDYWGNEVDEDAAPRSSDGQLLFLMEMVSKIKSLSNSPMGSRIASVHNGSSLFTGDAGGGESNIRRHIIENDLLEAIIQLPNNLFYNTGITTYIWLLTNKKLKHRQGKVQLIDAGQLYRKLRKNLGDKNCEFSPEHITEIVANYSAMKTVERSATDEGIASQVFDNTDFGYHKVTIERPKRLKAQLTYERIETLRFDKTLVEPMQWVYETYADSVYSDLTEHEQVISEWCETKELDLNAKKRKALLDTNVWNKQRKLLEAAAKLQTSIGSEEFNDFNLFKTRVDAQLKADKVKLTPAEKNAIYAAITWYHADAIKVIKKKEKLVGDKLSRLLDHLGCTKAELPHFGYFPLDNTTNEPSFKQHEEYTVYETESDLRDSENIPLKEDIQAYFIREVTPHVSEAWINLDATKIGYEISFNKHFYRHKPLRNIEDVSRDMLALEKESEGLIMDILGMAD
ncbi:MAG: N-6 DNA methylase [Methylococcales bacterium]